MKYFLISIVCFGMIACKTSKEVDNYEQIEQTASDGKVTGTIKVSNSGCSPIIEVQEAGDIVKMYPVNLDESLRINGVKIKFNYLPSRAQQPESCTFELKVVSIENVEVIKK